MKGINFSGTTRVRCFRALEDIAPEIGVDLQACLRKAELDPDLFRRRDDMVAYSSLGRLLHECIKSSGCEDLGLRIGMRESPGVLGLGGYAAANAPTVREGLQTLIDSLRLHDTGGTARLQALDVVAIFSWRLVSSDIERADHIADAAAAIGCNLMRALCGAEWNPIEVCLTRRRPKDGRLFTSFYRAPIRFEAEETNLVFPCELLGRKVIGRDEDLFEALSPLLDRALVESQGDFRGGVTDVLRSQVNAGPLTPARAAAALGLTTRSFARRLAENGASFLELAQQVKYDVAQDLLRRDKNIPEVAMILGYSDPTAFSRAFKLWSGKTPARWRADQRRGDSAAD